MPRSPVRSALLFGSPSIRFGIRLAVRPQSGSDPFLEEKQRDSKSDLALMDVYVFTPVMHEVCAAIRPDDGPRSGVVFHPPSPVLP
ncbi:hypothetical protein ACQP2T_24185 [Nonomuraea sp. CA-143628]|uniref:hypothetical protein n=1 Tax=Nonomuraea sp. CA-143628 TaxID=3239997 RepID=UPI003D925298